MDNTNARIPIFDRAFNQDNFDPKNAQESLFINENSAKNDIPNDPWISNDSQPRKESQSIKIDDNLRLPGEFYTHLPPWHSFMEKKERPKSPSESQTGEAVGDVHLRFLSIEDVEEIRTLCREVFPIEYPDYWYLAITTNPVFFSLGAVVHSNTAKGPSMKIIGILVAEVKRLSLCNAEDRDILSKRCPGSTAVAYILSLGVAKGWRRKGIASRLLDSFLAYSTNGVGTPIGEVQAVYLHVLCENLAAIRFYEQRHFKKHSRLTHYYQIKNETRDGYTYVLYLNGGKAPFSVLECCSAVLGVVFIPWNCFIKFVVGVVRGFCPKYTDQISWRE